ncbi:MAG: insulinase family protein [Alphaproteobacteria bacterium]|nr:MAG: insulinase family protein [Alphaproteobacteria bacterium]
MRLVASALMLIAAMLPARGATEAVEITSPGGITAWLVEEHAIPVVSLAISFAGGATLDPADRAGLASMMAALLSEGAGERDAVAFAEAAEALAARFSFSAGRDSVQLSASFLRENLGPALALLHDALVRPRFDPAAIERVRAQIISGIRADATDPDAIARRRFAELVFAGDPYARPVDGTEASVAAITRDDLLAAHRRLLVPGRARIAIVGDIGAEEAGRMLDGLLAGLAAEGPPLPGPAAMSLTGGVTVVGFDTPQSVVVFAQPGVARDDPDFFPAFVLNHILGGGGFSSRLTAEVREKRGLTYGVYSYLAGLRRADLWMGGVASANQRVAEAIAVIRAEWARAAREGVTAEELEAARTYLTGAWPLQFDSSAAIARLLVALQEDGRGIDYLTSRNRLIEAVTLEDVNRVARSRLDPARLRFVVVGRPVGLDPEE